MSGSPSRRLLDDQTPDVEKLFPQLRDGEVLFIGYQYGGRDSGLYLYERDQHQLVSRMRPAGTNRVTFYAVPEDDM
jgi:hypothetical protein